MKKKKTKKVDVPVDDVELDIIDNEAEETEEKELTAEEKIEALTVELAESMDALKTLQERGVVVIRSSDLSRTHRERLLKAGFSSCDVWFQCFNFMSMLAVK